MRLDPQRRKAAEVVEAVVEVKAVVGDSAPETFGFGKGDF